MFVTVPKAKAPPWYSNHAVFKPQQSQQIAARERRVVEDGNTAMDGFGAS